MFESIALTSLTLCLALLIDRLLGEPRSWHPLILFGRWADFCKIQVRHFMGTMQLAPIVMRFSPPLMARLAGILAWLLAVSPWMILLCLIDLLLPSYLTHAFSALILYFCLGWQSLREHGLAVVTPLEKGDIDSARVAVSHIVSRDTQAMDENQVAKAATESILENGSDAIFAPLFWFIIFGAPGALFYRLANTLDAMWGYKNEEYIFFGWFAARLDDVLNYLPARLVILTYAACGNFSRAIASAKAPDARWKSPNAGPVMAAGAGALDITLGGNASYFGKEEFRPVLGVIQGKESKLKASDLKRAVNLIDRGVYLWGIILIIFGFVF